MSRLGMTGSMQLIYTYQSKTPKQKAIEKWKKLVKKQNHWNLIYIYYKNGKKIETNSIKNIKGNGVKKTAFLDKEEAYKNFNKFKNQEITKTLDSDYRKVVVNQPDRLVIEKNFAGDIYKYVYKIEYYKGKGKKKRGKKNAKR